MVPDEGIRGIVKEVRREGKELGAEEGMLLTPHPSRLTVIKGRYDMDISVAATIGFTSLAIVGVIVLYAMMSRKR
jgi:hypothetical protein